MSTYQARKKALQNSRVTGAKLLSTSALTAAGILAFAATPALADNWVDLETTSGSTTTDLSNPNTTNISINSGRAIVEGDLDINAGWTVNVGAGQLIAIDRENDPTFILGNLNCAGSCHVLDADGTIFGSGSIVNAGSVTASTGDLMNRDAFMAGGNLELGNFSDKTIIIEEGATINVAEAGLAAFVSPFVSNHGTINARMGTVAFAAGETVTIDLHGDGLVELEVQGELENALLENTGIINAQGGLVQMTALAAKDTIDNIINVEGIITVASVEVQGGRIILSGGNAGLVTVDGTLDASGATGGGSIEVTGQNIHITENGALKANAANGDGGTAYVYADNVTVFEGLLEARAGLTGDGGNAEISAGQSVGYYGSTDLSAVNGETGTLLIDPEHLTISNDSFSFDVAAFFTGGLFGNININAQALADTLTNAHVNLWASETLSTIGDIDLSIGTEVVGVTYGGFFSGCFFGCPILADTITDHNLTIAAPQVNILGDVTLGLGQLNVYDLAAGTSVLGFGFVNVPAGGIQVGELNLDGRIYQRTSLGDPAFTTLADDAQINTTADIINVLSNAALIQQGIYFAEAGATLNVAADTYTENLIIDRALSLVGAPGTTLQAAVAGDALISVTASNVSIDPFTFDGLNLVSHGISAIGAGADGLVVDGNTFKNFNEAGVYVENTTGGTATIKNNIFEGSSTHAVYAGALGGGFTLNITDNEIGSVGEAIRYGIRLNEINDAVVSILGNTIYADNHGLDFRRDIAGADIDIHGNQIHANLDNGTFGAGISFNGAIGTSTIDIGNGYFSGTADSANFITVGGPGSSTTDGIRFAGDIGTGAVIEIDGNRIGYTGMHGSHDLTSASVADDGIEFAGNITGDAQIRIIDNHIDAADDGIQFSGSVGGTSNIVIGDAPGDENSIVSGDDGIVFRKAIKNHAEVSIGYNDIEAGGNGIHFKGKIKNHALLEIISNTIDADRNGIAFKKRTSNYVDGHGEEILIAYNSITGGKHGILFKGEANGGDHNIMIRDNTLIKGESKNAITHTGGISGAEITIKDNGEIYGYRDGIHIAGNFYDGASIKIQGNEYIRGVMSDGIEIQAYDDYGYYGYGRGFKTASVYSEGFDSFYGEGSEQSLDLLIDMNHIADSGDNGILLIANGGTFSARDEEGRFLTFDSGSGSGSSFFNSTITNNMIENNGTNGLYVQGSGHGDVILAGNTFIDNPVGARFESGAIDLSDIENPNTFIFTEEFEGDVVGMQFELANFDNPASLTIVGETLGATIFEGFIDRAVDEAFFVRFEDGAILDSEGGVIEINGATASWDGFIPAENLDVNGEIPFAAFIDIEARLFDADDPISDARGQIFVGIPQPEEAPTLENVEDFFRRGAVFDGDPNGFSITVTGLPSVGTPSAAAASPVGLANIEPSAGDEETPEDVANVEPAAGDEAVCWSDVASAASTGTPVSYSFGGSFEESLADASNCGS